MSDKPLQPLGDKQVEGVAGGYLYWPEDECYYRPEWEVIDGEGEVIASFVSYDEACCYAKKNGLSACEINSEELAKLRETGSPW